MIRMIRQMVTPIRLQPSTVERLKKAKDQLKKAFPNKKRVTYDDVIDLMLQRLGF